MWILRHAFSLRTVLACIGLAFLLSDATTTLAGTPSKMELRILDRLTATEPGGLYAHNRDPLVPSGLLKLPIGSIQPKGWLRHMLELERDGMTGHLKEISPWLDFEKSSWTDKEGRGTFGWEEMPYWLKGYGDLGYVLQDPAIISEAKKWIDAAVASQREDGWFGPRELLTSLNGKPDLWPHMVMLNVLQSYYEFSGDTHVLEVMTQYMRWQNQLPVSAFGEGYWPRLRMGDNIESCYWLYNRTGHPWLLDLAAKMHQGMARWDEDVINWHNVNIAQGFRAGTVFWMQSRNPKHLESADRNFRKVREMYGQFPGGGFVGDENCRPGYTDPRGGIETCGIVEFTHSHQMLTRITGNPVWTDRCEDIAFNSFPAAMTPDLKGLHYITSANQAQLDSRNKSPGIQNRGTMFSYSPFEVYRCCQHNVSHGWPYYAEELWLATHDNGLCASLYAACEVTAKAGDGVQVKLVEETDYPFDEAVTIKLGAPKPVRFPLYLRIPGWCESALVRLNGKSIKANPKPLSYLVINREWRDGDTVLLSLPMRVSVRSWPANKNAVSVHYGPLSFSLAIGEKWQSYGNRNSKWPEWEVFPNTSWNFGLVLDAKKPAKSFKLARTPGVLPAQPWTAQTVPISLRAKARKIPEWTLDSRGMVATLQPSPVKSEEPVEPITLVPMGAARLRLAMFPVVSTGPGARAWVAQNAESLSASHCFAGDSLEAATDGIIPKNSEDKSIPRFTWWDHRGSKEWLQQSFAKPRRVSAVEVYWLDDTGAGGGCGLPQSWQVSCLVSGRWVPATLKVGSTCGTAADRFNRVEFEPLSCSAVRVDSQLKPERSAGVLEWRVCD